MQLISKHDVQCSIQSNKAAITTTNREFMLKISLWCGGPLKNREPSRKSALNTNSSAVRTGNQNRSIHEMYWKNDCKFHNGSVVRGVVLSLLTLLCLAIFFRASNKVHRPFGLSHSLWRRTILHARGAVVISVSIFIDFAGSCEELARSQDHFVVDHMPSDKEIRQKVQESLS